MKDPNKQGPPKQQGQYKETETACIGFTWVCNSWVLYLKEVDTLPPPSITQKQSPIDTDNQLIKKKNKENKKQDKTKISLASSKGISLWK